MKITINGYVVEGTAREIYELLEMHKPKKHEWYCGVDSGIGSSITSTFDGTNSHPKVTGIKMTEFDTRNNENNNEPAIDFE